MSNGMTNYLRNSVIDWLHRSGGFVPPATMYVRLVTTTPTQSAAGAEVVFTGYAPVAIASTPAAWSATNLDGSTLTPSTGTTGTTSNNAAINFGTAGSAANAPVTHWELWDAATGGNRLLWGEIVDGAGVVTPRSIFSGDPVNFPASFLRVLWG
jgi:hypothetical protein